MAGTFSFTESNNCDEFTMELTVTMEDSYGNGWSGNILHIGDISLSLVNYTSSDATITVCL